MCRPACACRASSSSTGITAAHATTPCRPPMRCAWAAAPATSPTSPCGCWISPRTWRSPRVILSSDWNDPDILAQSPVLAQHLWLAGRHTRMPCASSMLSTPPRPASTACFHARQRAALPRPHGRGQRALRTMPGAAAGLRRRALGCRDPSPCRSTTCAPRAPAGRRRPACGRQPGTGTPALCTVPRTRRAGDIAAAWDALAQGARIMQRHARSRRACSKHRDLRSHDATHWLPPANAVMRQERNPCRCSWSACHALAPPCSIASSATMAGSRPVGERNDFAAAVSEVSDRFFSEPCRPRIDADACGISIMPRRPALPAATRPARHRPRRLPSTRIHRTSSTCR